MLPSKPLFFIQQKDTAHVDEQISINTIDLSPSRSMGNRSLFDDLRTNETIFIASHIVLQKYHFPNDHDSSCDIIGCNELSQRVKQAESVFEIVKYLFEIKKLTCPSNTSLKVSLIFTKEHTFRGCVRSFALSSDVNVSCHHSILFFVSPRHSWIETRQKHKSKYTCDSHLFLG